LPVDGAVVQASGMQVAGACAAPAKRFYSLMIEVCADEADTEALKLFSDFDYSGLEAVLNLPAGCKVRRCMEMLPEVAEVVIRM
jgi:hypothetical protein